MDDFKLSEDDLADLAVFRFAYRKKLIELNIPALMVEVSAYESKNDGTYALSYEGGVVTQKCESGEESLPELLTVLDMMVRDTEFSSFMLQATSHFLAEKDKMTDHAMQRAEEESKDAAKH